MEVRIQGRNLELNETVRDYVTKKLDRISRHLPSITSAAVELAMEKTRSQDHRIVAQITLDINGTILRSEERAANVTAAVDSIIDVLDRRVQRYKGKVYKSEQVKKAGKNISIRTLEAKTAEPLLLSQEEEAAPDEAALQAGKVVKVKRFPIKPMTIDEAAFQMELLGHDFFLFFNSQTNQYNVLYRRHDGDYGLIQPEPL